MRDFPQSFRTGKRKSDKDCAHRIYRQIRKSNPEILGQKIQKNCRSGSDRGPQAGGHLGFHKEELEKYTEESYSEEIKKIIATVKSYAEKYETEIPVIVAGGIYNREDVQKVDNSGC